LAFVSLTFGWDGEEAKAVFNDPFSITMPDPHHSSGENQEVDIGFSAQGRMLVNVYAERCPNIRVIGRSEAIRRERRE
jgi:uncharacterized DUF497 family protein